MARQQIAYVRDVEVMILAAWATQRDDFRDQFWVSAIAGSAPRVAMYD